MCLRFPELGVISGLSHTERHGATWSCVPDYTRFLPGCTRYTPSFSLQSIVVLVVSDSHLDSPMSLNGARSIVLPHRSIRSKNQTPSRMQGGCHADHVLNSAVCTNSALSHSLSKSMRTPILSICRPFKPQSFHVVLVVKQQQPDCKNTVAFHTISDIKSRPVLVLCFPT